MGSRLLKILGKHGVKFLPVPDQRMVTRELRATVFQEPGIVKASDSLPSRILSSYVQKEALKNAYLSEPKSPRSLLRVEATAGSTLFYTYFQPLPFHLKSLLPTIPQACHLHSVHRQTSLSSDSSRSTIPSLGAKTKLPLYMV